jgi:hypothetical protein
VDASHCTYKGVVRHPFDNVTASSSLQCLVNILIAFVGSENDELGVLMAGNHGADGHDATHSWKAKIHERDIGKKLFEELDGLFAAPCLSHRCHIGRSLDDGRDANAHDGVVVNNEHAYSW